MLVHRLRLWPYNKPTLGGCVVFAGYDVFMMCCFPVQIMSMTGALWERCCVWRLPRVYLWSTVTSSVNVQLALMVTVCGGLATQGAITVSIK